MKQVPAASSGARQHCSFRQPSSRCRLLGFVLAIAVWKSCVQPSSFIAGFPGSRSRALKTNMSCQEPQQLSSERNPSYTDFDYVFKLLVPRSSSGGVVGEGGAVIRKLQEETSCKLVLSSGLYPKTTYRVMSIFGSTQESVVEASKEIIELVFDHLPQGKQAGSILSVLIPRMAVGAILGREGATIKQIRETSGIQHFFLIDQNVSGKLFPFRDQEVILEGSKAAMNHVSADIIKHVHGCSSEPQFTGWARATWNGYRGWNSERGVDMLTETAQTMPADMMKLDLSFPMSVTLPKKYAGHVLGKEGRVVGLITKLTEARISVDREIPDDPDNMKIDIQGALGSRCAAYLKLMEIILRCQKREESAKAGSSSD
eukprot:TRINITY_DN1125_c1_g1_i1.p1 TRINITY_DN1125_c1_g1~~TRINITY_DN1125_c1_g1_i1.p1  ORF type:complete len:372 (+),score=51.58 TRINITY_DN1125_c1_g1_i1:80-1195(+)